MHIHWHRRDLRPADNRGLSAGTERGPVVPVFVFDPTILTHASSVRVAAMLEALSTLRDSYRAHDSDLVVAHGEPSAVLPDLASEYGANGVSWNDDYSGLARERDRAVTASLEDADLEVTTCQDAIAHEPGSITPNQGEHYSVFSYFWTKWRDRTKADPVDPPAADELAAVEGEPLPTVAELGFDEPEASLPAVTRPAGQARLESFCREDIYRYAEDRDYPAREGTSRLSAHLTWGTLGVREVYAATEDAIARARSDADRESVWEFRRQLAWREFYAHVLAYNPEIVRENVSRYEREIEWRTAPDEFAAWQRGETGYPIVDAGMRQLRAEGWMHNRVRMLVASFLTKDLLIDWRAGYDWFRRKLVDHDTANDVGGWQWAASTGTDAQPYFRVFNPMTQGERYDPDAAYIREYVPELEGVPAEAIHAWDDLEPTRRRDLAPDYPAPIVDHADRRELAIETFERARGDD
ncbi:cryptochrome/photolyase family protein [Natrialbaceae archaeon AArc-T1-2]|uniref:cryptochrome/photolyase family protein n=1 Tax=Natrialbaceae archaeon AArc-T1-2 TaxID=3053904 RepID=UPI00255B032D|nr:deoxyribodipyrimidine photo-lyase [Natrialbaceae archaeon AArc-T1-2]WIV67881.1 deoxyribodipyrimidine photo-lyase [Natrialbaceae archaeon AArc-T1-2]